jgi:hypothetical protein
MFLGSDEIAIDTERLTAALAKADTDTELFSSIVNTPFTTHKVETTFMFLGIVVLLLVNKKDGTIDRIALSNTELAQRTTEVSAVPFNQIKIGLDEPENIIAAAIKTGEPHDTTDWRFLFQPALTAEEARINQANAGIAYSAVYPLTARDGGALIFSYYQYKQELGGEQNDFMKQYAAMVNEALGPRAEQ